MVSALYSGLSGPGSRPGRGHCVVFMCKTLNSHSASGMSMESIATLGSGLPLPLMLFYISMSRTLTL